MLEKFLSFFSAIAIFFQMLMGGYPMFGGKTVELRDFTVSGGIAQGMQTYDFSNPDKTRFNKFELTYDADAYVRGEIFYTYKSKGYSEEFYLEPGTDAVYASFIDGYLSYGCGQKISKITFASVQGGGSFTLKAVKTSVAEVYDEVVYIENSRYKLGASLLWGGAISYLEDFSDNDSSLTNLINCHDTGRLVQQSYYGTNSAPYVPGMAFDVTWSYNPVQGGNKYNQSSKIIDIQRSEGRLYIKGRARDWAKPEFTYCYMENTYTLYGDRVQVDNRFVDYSPYTHPLSEQECPAFYTVSALGTFIYYDGENQWADDTLTIRNDLGFWGDPNEPQVNKSYASPADESWSAWVNSASDWGIGVYTPGVKGMKAGRYEYDGTKDAAGNATNYVAPLGRFQLVQCSPSAYSYLITSGTTDEMRAVFKSLKDAIQNDLLL
ncbi:MAG: hypothetical protein LBS36_10780 [Oscillospiraceae bacterium]|jgi:hypothetical protein|nr:hypothetical protein [Oscillospiraceae bacterium]